MVRCKSICKHIKSSQVVKHGEAAWNRMKSIACVVPNPFPPGGIIPNTICLSNKLRLEGPGLGPMSPI